MRRPCDCLVECHAVGALWGASRFRKDVCLLEGDGDKCANGDRGDNSAHMSRTQVIEPRGKRSEKHDNEHNLRVDLRRKDGHDPETRLTEHL